MSQERNLNKFPIRTTWTCKSSLACIKVFFSKAIFVVGEVKVGQGDLKPPERGEIDVFRFGNFFASESSQFAIPPLDLRYSKSTGEYISQQLIVKTVSAFWLAWLLNFRQVSLYCVLELFTGGAALILWEGRSEQSVFTGVTQSHIP